MITISNISVQYGNRILLEKVNLILKPKDKVGLVGRNGAGKTTLLKIISKNYTPDSGTVDWPRDISLGFLQQEIQMAGGKTVLDEALTAFEAAREVENKIRTINLELGRRTDYESDEYLKLLEDLSLATDRFTLLGGHNMEATAEQVLKGLGFTSSDFNRLTDEFSGGWKMRIELAKMLLAKPDYLLLDEPTNHLDIESIIWLEEFLRQYAGAVILISHDKTFLDNVTERTIEIELGKIYDYKAPYSKYLEMREERRALQSSAFKNQQRVIAEKERTINRFMAKATKTKMAQSMKKQLDKMERIEIEDADLSAMNLTFPAAPRSGRVVVEAKSISKAYGSLKVLEKVNLKLDRGDRVAFVGQNGQGKTTLAKILIRELEPTSGQVELGHNIQIGYYAQDQSESLHPNLTLLETMEHFSPPEMRTRLRNILGAFMFSGEDADKKVMVLSGGERARLALACLLLRPFNLLVLDEPTNHLDILSKEVLKNALQQYDGTLIVVSHDRDFLSGLTNRTLEFRDQQLYEYIGDVNAFLEKRALDNMRQVELSSSGRNEKENTVEADLDFKERKRRQRLVQNAEKKIEQLESKINRVEIKMADPDFYQQPGHQDQIAQYKQLKQDLEHWYQKWEKAQEELED